MLLEFACSNHKSIRDEVLFSMVAGKDGSHKDNTEPLDRDEVLKSAVIYGANGSGKTNFIDAIAFVRNLVVSSIHFQPGQKILQHSHKLDRSNKKSSYRIQFAVDGIRYAFGFSLQDTVVTEEYLYYFPNGRQTKIFERTGEITFEAGYSFQNKFNSCKDVLKPNRLMLSCAANFSAVEEVAAAFRFFHNDLVIYNPASLDAWMDYSLHQINENTQIKRAVLDLMAALGTDIQDIRVKIKQEEVTPSNLPPFLSDELKNLFLQGGTVDSVSTKVVYPDFETDLMLEESTGIKKLFGMLCPLIDIMANGKVLVCDELESGLHEALVFELVKQFVRAKNPKIAQMIFTTHETGLLNLDLFRRDQIWFTEIKTSDRSTDLYSLAEIKNVRKDENYQRGYIAGKYGAIPMLNLDFANAISKL